MPTDLSKPEITDDLRHQTTDHAQDISVKLQIKSNVWNKAKASAI